MKLFIFIALAMMLVGMTAQAAEVPTSEGDKAMIFMFNGLSFLSLDSTDDYYDDYNDEDYDVGFGMRYYISDNRAIRGTVTFGSHATVTERDAWDEDKEETYRVIGLDAAYEMHMEGPCSSVSPYWGIGAGFVSSTEECKDENGNEETTTGTGFGGYCVLGFEWAFANCMTLGGEYRAGLWAEAKETEDVAGVPDQTIGEADFGFATASVYLSVYF
jgi:opacity protein-like surface antigen